jgi:hypothetical protein
MKRKRMRQAENKEEKDCCRQRIKRIRTEAGRE